MMIFLSKAFVQSQYLFKVHPVSLDIYSAYLRAYQCVHRIIFYMSIFYLESNDGTYLILRSECRLLLLWDQFYGLLMRQPPDSDARPRSSPHF